MKILYFAFLRDIAGIAEEEVHPPPEVVDVSTLIAWLRRRGGGPAKALGDLSRVRAAVNEEHAPFDAPVRSGDEVAFFPPVTGGAAAEHGGQ